MSQKTVDARGQLCPKPLILTKKALAEIKPGETVVVLIDNETSRQNIERFCSDNGAICSTVTEGNIFKLTVEKNQKTNTQAAAEKYCSTPAARHVICITDNKMGKGSDELGTILIKGFVNTIKEIAPLPEAIILYNNGIHLAAADSPLLLPLQELEKMGVTIMVCGTCADYFNKKEQLKVGTVSNMYAILQVLTRAGHIIYP